MNSHSIHKQYIIAISLIIVVAIGIILFSQKRVADTDSNFSKDDNELVFCTADAMQCPDGSFVGRTGPNCEFECPDVSVIDEAEVESETQIELIQ